MTAFSSDISVFTDFYHKHKHQIFNYILYRVSFSRMVAEDLTSEIFIKAFVNFHTFDRNRSFKTWIFTIPRNHLINYYKARKETLSLDEAIKVADNDKRFDQMLAEKSEIEKLMKVVADLPTAQRELIIMRYINELSNHEIAEVLHKDEGAVRTALSRALALLRKRYEITRKS